MEPAPLSLAEKHLEYVGSEKAKNSARDGLHRDCCAQARAAV
jgi:hypothetical protein